MPQRAWIDLRYVCQHSQHFVSVGKNDQVPSILISLTAMLIGAFPMGDALGAVRAESRGVTLEAYTLRDRVVFCIRADEKLHISAEYGITFIVEESDAPLWSELMPKTITGANWYFQLPLRIDLLTRKNISGHRIKVDLGSCTNTECNAINFDLTLPLFSDTNEMNKKSDCK